MNALKNALLWLWLLTKRLYRRNTFLVLLVLIPALVLGYASIDTEESGMLTVAVAQAGCDTPEDSLMQALQKDSQLLYFRPCASAKEARELVAAGKVDTAWIFPKDVTAGVKAFVDSPTDHPFVQVVVREDSVMLRLARERLSSAAYPRIARQVFLTFIRQLAPELDPLSDEALLERYENTLIEDELFSFDEEYAQMVDTHYLLSPLRGLLGLVILLCALATAMYHLRDLRQGTFCRMGPGRRWIPELAGQVTAVTHVAVAAAVCLSLAGLSANLWRELALVVLYSLCHDAAAGAGLGAAVGRSAAGGGGADPGGVSGVL